MQTSRFTQLYDEYRILGVDIELICSNPTTGVTAFFWDEAATGAPTLNEARDREVLSLTNNACNPKSCSLMTWRARDINDLSFDPITSTSTTPVWFKVYTDNTNFGSGTTTTDSAQWYVKPTLYVEFRGLRGV